jgi:hypothetical protein
MKLDYISDINEYGDDMVRLFDFDRSEATQFKQLIEVFLFSKNTQIDLAEIDFIEPRNCNLVLRISEEDEGIISDDLENFVCNLTQNGYQKMLKLLDPFCKRDTIGFQFLYDLDTPTDFLFAPAGSW